LILFTFSCCADAFSNNGTQLFAFIDYWFDEFNSEHFILVYHS